MIPVGDHGLACLDDTDPAAVALYMQDQALVIDATLDGISDTLDTFYLRPGAVLQPTAISGPNASLGETIFGIAGTWVVVDTNFTVSIITNGMRISVPKTGWYNYGCYANMQATGAVTLFSRRSLHARATRQTVGPSTLVSEAVWKTGDTNTGGEFLVASNASFYATMGETFDVEGYWSHNNAASTVQVNAGARLWCHYIGSGVEIGSA